MLLGLSAKNAILIVEFAKSELEKGKPLVEAALEGAKVRLRPILMTSLAFICSCIPLWIASGADSVARQTMGTTVIGGMLAATFIGTFFIPAMFVLVEKTANRGGDKAKKDQSGASGSKDSEKKDSSEELVEKSSSQDSADKDTSK